MIYKRKNLQLISEKVSFLMNDGYSIKVSKKIIPQTCCIN